RRFAQGLDEMAGGAAHRPPLQPSHPRKTSRAAAGRHRKGFANGITLRDDTCSMLWLPDTFFFKVIPIFFQQLPYLGVYYQHTIGLITISVIIIFMIVFSRVEVGEGSNFGNNRLVISPRFFNCRFRRKSNASLLVIMIENCGAILGSDIVSLAVQ